jgi:hypothetical protein
MQYPQTTSKSHRRAPEDLPMTSRFSVVLATALTASLLLVAGCAEMQSAPSGPAPETGTALPPPEPGENTEVDALQAPLPGEAATAGKTSGEPVIVKGPDGTTWAVPTATNEEIYQADVEDCHRYALAQTRHDEQIRDDRNAGIDTLTSESRYSGLRKRVDEFDLRNRRTALMSSCMNSKGYARADTVLPRLEF